MSNKAQESQKPCSPINGCTEGNPIPSKLVEKSKMINGDIIMETQNGEVFRIEGAGSLDIMETGGKAWRSDITYEYGDIVTYDFNIYLATAKNRNCPPDEVSSKWEMRDRVGPPGPDGEMGETGPTGPTGATGLQGIAGPMGPQGEKGFIGDKGPKGDVGEHGFKGDVGPSGPEGVQGPVGDQGIQGDAGIHGAKGEQGDVGHIGPTGSHGQDGADGVDGSGVRIIDTLKIDDILALAHHTPPPAQGDMYIAEDTDQTASVPGDHGDGYVWTGNRFTNVGPIKGPRGDKGSSIFTFTTQMEFDSLPIMINNVAVCTASFGNSPSVGRSAFTTGDVFDCDGTDYSYRGSIRGPKGYKGDKGNKGDKGDKGDKGNTQPLASQAEVNAGSDATKAVSPKTLRNSSQWNDHPKGAWSFDGTTLRITIR